MIAIREFTAIYPPSSLPILRKIFALGSEREAWVEYFKYSLSQACLWPE